MTSAQKTPVKIAFLAENPQHLPELSRWLYEEWDARHLHGSLEQREQDLERRMNRDQLPLALVALRGETLLGTASLRWQEVEIRPQYEHWLSTVYVHPPYRHGGVGALLVQAAAAQAERLGIGELYLYTRRAESEAWYARLGWQPVERPIYQGRPAVIMLRRLA
jgi:GNAT superfamily N-acetyltransferase